MWNDWLRDFLIVFAAQIQCLRRQHRHTIYLRWLIANGSHDISIRKFRIIAHFSLLLFLCISCPNEVENIANNGPAASWFTSIKWCSASETQTACVCVCVHLLFIVSSHATTHRVLQFPIDSDRRTLLYVLFEEGRRRAGDGEIEVPVMQF